MFKDKSFTENMVAQILTAKGDALYYHTFRINEQSHLREIDFLTSRSSKICPIAVKSSRIDRHVSLDEFCVKYSARILKKYIIHTKDFSKDKDIFCTPIYTCPFI